jgi:succinate dehydrogenase hydrophobic anchor subunit
MAAPQVGSGPAGKPLQIIRQESWAKGSGVNAWIWQRITAVALIVLLGGHMWVNHYADLAYPADHYITFLGV